MLFPDTALQTEYHGVCPLPRRPGSEPLMMLSSSAWSLGISLDGCLHIQPSVTALEMFLSSQEHANKQPPFNFLI